jgi:hypothetical protein
MYQALRLINKTLYLNYGVQYAGDLILQKMTAAKSKEVKTG